MEIQPFSKIESLILDNNKLTNTSVSMIINSMKSLKKLMLNSNNFDAVCLINISNLTNLRYLQVNSNNLGDACMETICKLPNLIELSVSKNKITDKGVDCLSSLA